MKHEHRSFLTRFATKHKLNFERYADNEIVEFSGKNYFSLDDIAFDITQNCEPHLIKQYSAEGLESSRKMPTFEIWYKNQKQK